MFAGVRSSFSGGDWLLAASAQQAGIPALLFPLPCWPRWRWMDRYWLAQELLHVSHHLAVWNRAIFLGKHQYTLARSKRRLGNAKLCDLVDWTKEHFCLWRGLLFEALSESHKWCLSRCSARVWRSWALAICTGNNESIAALRKACRI